MISGIFFIVILPLFFAPSIVALIRGHQKKLIVFALNLLTGWTIIGWVAALVWAIIGSNEPEQGPSSEVFR